MKHGTRTLSVLISILCAGVACDSKAPSQPPLVGDKVVDEGKATAADAGAGVKEAPAAPLSEQEKKLVQLMRFEHGRVLGTAKLGLPAFAADADTAIRARAALAIGRVGDPAGLAVLEGLFADKSPQVRTQAAFAAALIAIEGEDEAVSKQARDIILKAWETEKTGDAETARALVWSMRKVGGKSAEGLSAALGQALRSDDESVRAVAMVTIALLARFKPDTPGIKDKALIQLIRLRAADTEATLREPALYALMRIKDPEHDAELKQAIERMIPEAERSVAVRGLSAMKKYDLGLMRGVLLPPPDSTEENPEPVDYQGDPMTQVAAVRHLTAEGGEQAAVLAAALVEDFLPQLADHGRDLNAPRFHVFLTLAENLPKLKDKARARALLERIHKATLEGRALTRKESSFGEKLNVALLQCAAAASLDKLAGALDKVNTCGQALKEDQRSAIVVYAFAALDKTPTEKITWLLARYKDSTRPVKVAILTAASGLAPKKPAKDAKADKKVEKPDPKLLEGLQTLAKAAMAEDDSILRGYGINISGDLAYDGSVEAVRKLLAAHDASANPGGDLDEVLAALDTLAKLNDADSLDAIKPWTANPDHMTRKRATKALKTIDKDAKPAEYKPSLAEARPEFASSKPISITMRTTRGNITVKLRPDLAPATVHNFLSLAKKGFYDGLTFHRVIANFVSQGGDPRGDGNGGPGYTLPAEWSMAPYNAGVLGMAHAGKDTGGCQFFFTHAPHPHLDGGYTVFGEVTEGMESVLLVQQGDRIIGVDIAPSP